MVGMEQASQSRLSDDGLAAARVRIFRNRVLAWFRVHGRALPWRRPDQSLYRLLVTEVLLQRTKAESVAAVYDQFFAQYPDWQFLATADRGELSQILRYLGLWSRRPPKLIAFAQAVVAMDEKLPATREALEKIPAVGQYVASASLLFTGLSNEPLLDEGMSRVLERFFGSRILADIRYDGYLQALARDVVDCQAAVPMNWGLLDLAALVCRKQDPKCGLCPLINQCRRTGMSGA